MNTPGRKMVRTNCGGKIYYPSKRDAVTAMNLIMGSRRGKQRHGRPEFLRAYPCDRCNGWHLTSKELRE